MKYILSCLLLVWTCGWILCAQPSSTWQTYLPDTYVYQLSTKEVEEMFIYPDRTTEVLTKVRHKPLYTTFRDTWNNTPQSGHFLLFNIKDNREEYRYRSFIPYQVMLLSVYDAFTVQVIDSQGIPRKDASVTLIDVETKKRYKLRYDPTSKTYTIPLKESDDFLLITELDGVRSYFNGDTRDAPKWEDDDEEELIKEESRIYSYLITDKYTYKPGDTVRVKSYILSGRRKPLKKEMTIQVGNNSSFKNVNTISPHRPGSFAGGFVLDGSLDLKLDKEYKIRLVDKEGAIMATTWFKYEDYQLFDYDLHVDVTHPQHFYPDTNYIRIHATDVNNLPLLDTPVEVAILRGQMGAVYGGGLYTLPDTIVSKKITIGREPYTLALPCELFGKADLTYQVKVDATLPDYRKLTEVKEVGFHYKHKELVHSLRDSVWLFEYMERGKSNPVTAMLHYNGEKTSRTVQLPHTEPFNPDISSYTFTIEPLPETIKFTTSRMIDLEIEAGFTNGFFHASLHNPLGIQTVWYIYHGEELVKKGSGEQIGYRTRAGDDETNWYVDVFYRLDDEMIELREKCIPLNKQLHITTDLPKRIYPGEEVEATIQVKNSKGQPVKQVDLTAFAVNGLLNETFAPLPYYGEIMGERRKKDTYWFNPFGTGTTTGIDFEYWKTVAALDTLPFYRFLYPEYKTLFIHTEEPPGAITQFAPFVMQEGEPKEIKVIECDGELIWFSWISNAQNYSFPIDPGKAHTIKLRTDDTHILIETDPGFFKPGMKTLFSMLNREGSYTGEGVHWQVESRSRYFSEKEKEYYLRYVSEIPVPAGEYYTFLKQGEKEILVQAEHFSGSKTYCRVGPVAPGITNYNGLIEYEHEGGYRYDYKGNSVYKSVIKDPVPGYLYYNSLRFPYGEMNEFYIPADSIRKKREQPVAEENRATASFTSLSQFLISQDDMDVVINMKPLQNTRVTQVVLIPVNGVASSTRLSGGLYELYVVYDDGKYLHQDSLELLPFQYHSVSLENHCLQEADDYLQQRMEVEYTLPDSKRKLRQIVATPARTGKTKNKRQRPDIEHYQEITPKKNSRSYGRYSYYIPPADSYRYGLEYDYTNVITGTVLDEYDEPIIGANVVIKGSTTGTITDLDGKFTLTINGYVSQDVTIVVSYIGYQPREMKVVVGSSIRVQLQPASDMLDEVVITGYGYSGGSSSGSESSGNDKKENRKASSYTETLPLEKEEEYDPEAERMLYLQLANLNRLRSNFSDVGFWQPRLYTNNKGEATFKVTFPDNLTRWDAVVYAMNTKLQTGTYLSSIQSYKPLMAEWLTPAFMVVGDTAYAESLIRDYTGLTEINGSVRMTAPNDTVEAPVQFRTVHQKKYPIYASTTDTLSTSFIYTGADGYMDGEERQIPVNSIGVPIRKERMHTLLKGDTAHITREADEKTTLILNVRFLDLHLNLAAYLVGYEYACNEQLASKLVGLLITRKIRHKAGEIFEYDGNIVQIIQRLIRNQNDEGCWGWWNKDIRTDAWITNHVLRILKMAADAGFEVTITPFPFIYNTEKSSLIDNIELLYAHSLWGTAMDPEYQIEAFEKLVAERVTTGKNDLLREKMLLLELRKMNGMPYSLEEVTRHLKLSTNKNLYCYDRYGKQNEYATMSAYRMLRDEDALKADRAKLQYTLVRIANKYGTTWWKAIALFSIYPDLEEIINQNQVKAVVSLTGYRKQQIIKFPYSYRMEEQEMSLKHQSGLPVFVNTAHESITTQQVIEGPFTIRTWFEGGDTLQQGVPMELSVEVKSTTQANYVMIEIPIPAGCVYDSKPTGFPRETHREYFKEKTVIFIHSLNPGTHHFTVPLIPRFEGVYHLNPAKISKMYAPSEFSTTQMRKIRIKSKTHLSDNQQ